MFFQLKKYGWGHFLFGSYGSLEDLPCCFSGFAMMFLIGTRVTLKGDADVFLHKCCIYAV